MLVGADEATTNKGMTAKMIAVGEASDDKEVGAGRATEKEGP